MFRIFKFIIALVRENNEYQRGFADILLKIKNPNNDFIESGIDEIDCAFYLLDKLHKENKELKEQLLQANLAKK